MSRDASFRSDVIVLQRLAPHYRVPLFRRLWSEYGWRTVVASNPPENTGLKLAEGEHPFLLRVPFRFTKTGNAFRCVAPVGAILKATGARAVISEFSLQMTSSYDLAARRTLLGEPLVVFWSHGYNMDRGFSTPGARLLQAPRVLLFMTADGHVCYSEEGREFLSRFLPRDRLFVARNTIDLAPIEKARREIEGPLAAPGSPHLLSIGRLTPDKQIPTLVRAFRRLLVAFPGAALTIVGDGPDLEAVRTAAGDPPETRIRILGPEFDESRLALHFASADVAVFQGAVGLSVNHALAHGVPVVAFDRSPGGPAHHPEIAYVVDGITGRRIPGSGEVALFEGVSSFLRDYPDPRASFAETIERFVRENLTLDAIVRDFGAVRDFLAERLPVARPPETCAPGPGAR